MIKPALVPVKVETVNLVTANINLALAIRAINTPAPVPAIPAAQVLPVTANIRNVNVNRLILGTVAPVLAPLSINTPAPVQDTPVAPAPHAEVNILRVNVPQIMSGKMELANYLTEPKKNYITAMVKLLAFALPE